VLQNIQHLPIFAQPYGDFYYHVYYENNSARDLDKVLSFEFPNMKILDIDTLNSEDFDYSVLGEFAALNP
jgi:hypothetical protein